MRKPFVALMIMLVAAACAGANTTAQPSAPIRADALMRHVSLLAADSMRGRLVGSPENAKARAYVAAQFGAAGLERVGASFEHPTEVRRDTLVRRATNVVGLVRGRTNPDRYIVVTAHFDHVGVRNGEIYNGADDNASGTGALIELARWFAANRPANSILFVGLDAEEGGLIGARGFVANPPVPLASIVMNVNMDMVGRNTKNELYAAGTSHYPFLRVYLDSVIARAPITLRLGHDDPNGPPQDNWTSQSDHAAFHNAKIPFIYFGEEDHPDYHKPTDDTERLMPAFYAGAVATILDAIRTFDRNLGSVPARAAAQDLPRWQGQAQNVTIVRDDWGIPHVYGKTDADAVFGLMYAQAEDDFNRVEMNFINSLGRLAETEGESAIFRDLRMKLFINPDSMKAMYGRSPDWLKALMNAWADGLNYYLHTHPAVKPKVITRFEPWMALSFSEGSIGGDIERVSIPSLRAFYGGPAPTPSRSSADQFDGEPRGSNGIAIGPSKSANGRALLLINPHTSFFFRAEAQAVSEEGLNAYGALTWGQFFIYQGFNDRAGWMHTSSSVDNIDEYLETVVQRDGKWFYRHGSQERPVSSSVIRVPYKTASGMAAREFTVFRTHHGPVVRSQDGKWVSVALMEEPLKALQQSYLRTKARSLAEYRKVMDLHTNSSNNTLYADADGNFAYFHSNFVPRRDTSFDWSRPVDGSNPATDWKGVHTFDESPNVVNPSTGWVYNTNNWPYSAAGPNSPRRQDYPAYMDEGSENPRGLHAIRVLKDATNFTIPSLMAAAYDSYLTAFEVLLPPLIRDFDATPASDPVRQKVAEQIALLRPWNYRYSVESVPTSLAIYYGDAIQRAVARSASRERMSSYDYAISRATASERLAALAAASDSIASAFGTWRTPWGEINRFQRISPEIVHPFDDKAPSIPVAFPSARWGSLASFGASPKPGTRKWYGTSGNSFVAVVEFGRDSVRARAVTAGGQSGDPKSRHFNDQALRYSTGDLRPVYFYRNQLVGHIEREYRPGQ